MLSNFFVIKKKKEEKALKIKEKKKNVEKQ